MDGIKKVGSGLDKGGYYSLNNKSGTR